MNVVTLPKPPKPKFQKTLVIDCDPRVAIVVTVDDEDGLVHIKIKGGFRSEIILRPQEVDALVAVLSAGANRAYFLLADRMMFRPEEDRLPLSPAERRRRSSRRSQPSP